MEEPNQPLLCGNENYDMYAMCPVVPSRSDSSSRMVRVCSLVALYRFRDLQPYGSGPLGFCCEIEA